MILVKVKGPFQNRGLYRNTDDGNLYLVKGGDHILVPSREDIEKKMEEDNYGLYLDLRDSSLSGEVSEFLQEYLINFLNTMNEE